ncbi:cell division protein SepF [Stomatobaculum longum]|jgi:hypothetical protein|uniref:cell division protein SepF n=1 Tax=Stomatobaculum longum TaxID=796942 RepID=UPI0028D3E683|nr:cell division protein SepF [Stomatobaculum longum]
MGFFSTIKEKFGGSFGGGDDGMDPDEEIYGTYGEDDEFIGDDDYGQEYIEDEEDDGIGGSNPFGGVDRVSANQGRKNTSTQKHSSATANRSSKVSLVSRGGCDNIAMMQPRSFEDKEMFEAVSNLRDQGRVIILNLESCDATTRMNFYTYAMGLCAGVDGKMGQVSESIFIIAPRNITLSGALTSGESQADPLMQARSV